LLKQRSETNKFLFYKPYPKQKEFHDAGKEWRVRILAAANRLGKTYSAAAELSFHLTGQYPHWWNGKRFDTAIQAWAASKTNEMTRDGAQDTLLGPPGSLGSGLLPLESIVKESIKAKHHVSNGVESVLVKHISGGYSNLTFKSYDQGRESFQAASRHVIWLDEEPQWDIFSEGLTRTATVNGVVLMTFTPLMGATEVVTWAFDNDKKNCCVVTASWDDAPHLDEKTKRELEASYAPHEREARTKGIPVLGSGKVYPIEESIIFVPRFKIPSHYLHCYGLDFGYSNPTAAMLFAIDPDTRIAYAYAEYYRSGLTARENGANIKALGCKYIPGFYDPSGDNVAIKDGENTASLYQDEGLDIYPANNSKESGVLTVLQLMRAGQLKFFDDLHDFKKEFRYYRRDFKGKIVNKDNHLLDALRYAVVSGFDLAKPKAAEKLTDYQSNNSQSKQQASSWMTV
jgi:phage terminase large subunit-like protein